jgi:capsular exopolysaccharide synthesis family protein
VLIREYWALLRPRAWIIVVITLVSVGAATAYSMKVEPTYVARAEMLVNPLPTATVGTVPATSFTSLMKTEASIATSVPVAKEAAENASIDVKADELIDRVTATPTTDTEILVIEATGRSGTQARRIANAIAEAYLDFRRQAVVDRMLTASEAVEDQIDEIEQSIEETNEQLAESVDEAETATLSGRVSALQGQITFLREKLVESTPVGTLDVGQVIRPAETPEQPESPQPLRNGLLALGAGLFAGIGIALLEERLGDKLRGRADLQSCARAPVLGLLPRIKSRLLKRGNLVTETAPHSDAGEAYRTLRTGVLMAANRRPPKTVVITSPGRQEGKSMTTANLAIVLAQAGKRVIAVSGDLRHPTLAELFSVSDSVGLTNVLAGEITAADALLPVASETPTLRLLPTGPLPSNPAELLESEALRVLLSYLREASDCVLIDAPPYLDVADAAVLVGLSDGVLLLADARNTKRDAVLETRQRLDQAGARVLGAVLNRYVVGRAAPYFRPSPGASQDGPPEHHNGRAASVRAGFGS